MNTRAAQVAFLVACHNDGATLRETIDSLVAEPETELVIVDDGSTDIPTLDLLVMLEQAGIRVLHQENAGPSAAWMAGLHATTAGYVMPFSSDDLLFPGSAAVLVEALDHDQGAAAAWGDMITFGLVQTYRPMLPKLCPWQVTYTNCLPAIALFRRSAVIASGGWQGFSFDEDWDLWMRMASIGQRGVNVGRPVVNYRRDGGGLFESRTSDAGDLYGELRRRNADLFAARKANRQASPAPLALKLALPLLEAIPGIPRLKKIQLSDALTLLLWTGGLRTTAKIVAQGIRYRLRRRPAASASANHHGVMTRG